MNSSFAIIVVQEKLQNVGINAADISKLRTSGYCTVLSVIQTTVSGKNPRFVRGYSVATSSDV